MKPVVAVTGATGFLGGNIVRRLAADGWTVRALIRREGALPDLAGVTPVLGSLDSVDSLAKLVDGADCIVHSAGLVRAGSLSEFENVNVEGTRRLAETALSIRRKPYIVQVSSLAARAPGLSDYAASKASAEFLLTQYGDAIRCVTLRPPAVYGPGDREILALFRQLRRGLAPIPRVADARLSMLYAGDLAAAVAALLDIRPQNGTICEVHDGCEKGYTWHTIIDHAASALEMDVRRLYIPKMVMQAAAAANTARAVLTGRPPMITPGKVREIYHPDWVCRDNPVARITDWRPQVMIDEGFRRTLTWYRKAGWI